MDNHSKHPVFHRNVVEMLAVAFEYCRFMEKLENVDKLALASYLLKVLPLLYVKGELLPEIEVEYPEANERFVIEEEWERLFNHIRIILGTDDIYFTFDPPAYGWGESLKTSLAEHLADIYQDMKDFVVLYQKNSLAAKENAVAECRHLFLDHWGPRVASSLLAFHYLYHDGDKPYFANSGQ